LKYNAVGHETDPTIGGKVLSTSRNAMDGFTLELVNPKTHWRSGKVVLRTDATFIVGLLAEKGERNIFNIELFDRSGTRQKTVPDHLIYTVGAVVEEQCLTNSMGVALANNEVAWFFNAGDA
jgi:molecular chaperone DnaK